MICAGQITTKTHQVNHLRIGLTWAKRYTMIGKNSSNIILTYFTERKNRTDMLWSFFLLESEFYWNRSKKNFLSYSFLMQKRRSSALYLNEHPNQIHLETALRRLSFQCIKLFGERTSNGHPLSSVSPNIGDGARPAPLGQGSAFLRQKSLSTRWTTLSTNIRWIVSLSASAMN